MTFETIYEVKLNDDDPYSDRYAFVKRTSSDKVFVEYSILYVHAAFTKKRY